jgi:hypothetical protein
MTELEIEIIRQRHEYVRHQLSMSNHTVAAYVALTCAAVPAVAFLAKENLPVPAGAVCVAGFLATCFSLIATRVQQGMAQRLLESNSEIERALIDKLRTDLHRRERLIAAGATIIGIAWALGAICLFSRA